jgi:dTDP-glucose 4,6-dehydratase
MTNLLVTGGAGFLGSHFVRSVLADRLPGLEGARVTVLDKLTYAGNFANLGPVAHDKRLDFVPGDVADPALVDVAFRDQDAVVHFAAETSTARSVHDPAAFTASNVLGTQILLDAALRHGTGRFVQISDDAVYGSLDDGVWPEDTPLAPTSAYAATKAAADLLALACHRTHGLEVAVARVSTVYGPFQHPEKTLPRYVTSLLDGRPLRLPGAGTVVRDWLHADDCCRAVGRVLTDGRAGGVYHIGGSLELTERDLARLILENLHEPADRLEPADVDVPPRDHRRALDDNRIRRELGWHPRVEFTTGLAGTIHWYRTNPGWWRPLLTV